MYHDLSQALGNVISPNKFMGLVHFPFIRKKVSFVVLISQFTKKREGILSESLTKQVKKTSERKKMKIKIRKGTRK